MVKWLKEDRTLVFKKENEGQIIFNDNVKDQIDATEKQLELVEPPNEA